MRRFAVQGLKAFCALAALSVCRDSAAADPNVIAEFEVARGGDVIIVPVKINGKVYRFMVDTGASISAMDDRHRQLLGDRLTTREMRVPGEMRQIDVFTPPIIWIGTTLLSTGAEFGAVDLAPLQEAFPKKIDGILGADVLMQLVLNIDFDIGKVRFLKTASNPIGEAIPMAVGGGSRAFIEAELDGDLPCRFLIDTGSLRHNIGSMDPIGFKLLHSMGCLTLLPGSSAVFPLGKRVETQCGRLSSIRIGSFRHDGAILERVPFWNSLGMGFFSRYVSTFDFPNRVLYLKAGERFGERDAIDASGFVLKHVAGDIVVERVNKRSAAESGGAHAGDVLVRMDGEPVKEWSVYRAERRLHSAGEHVLIVQRSGAEHSIQLLIPGNNSVRGAAR